MIVTDWSGDMDQPDRSLEIIPASDLYIRAVFQKEDQVAGKIVLNEINYNSATDFDPEDRTELYNHSDQSVDLSGYRMQNSNAANRFILPAGTVLAARQYLVLCRDSMAFSQHFSSVKNVLGDIPFGFDARGDHLQLCSVDGSLVDSLTYGTLSPWPESPDGRGPTLGLRHPDLDNSEPSSWQASQLHGTPGNLNDVFLEVDSELEPIIPDGIAVVQNYPNPFNNSTTISFSLPRSGPADISIYSINGELIDRIAGKVYPRGWNRVRWTMTSGLASGLYFYIIRFDRDLRSDKLVYLK